MKRSLSENVKKGAAIIGGSILSVYSMWTMISSIPNANAAGTCIVTIFGKQYDVAPLQTSHSGGNVFTCGTDMSSVYQGMHGTNISKIASFLVNTPTPTPTPVVSPTPTPSPTPVVTPTPGVTPAPTPTPVVTPTPTPTGTVITHSDDSDEHENEEHRGDSDEDDDDKDEHKNSGRTRHHLDELKKEDRRGDSENEDDKKVHSESRNED
jgi:hypothetical protein